MGANKTDLFSLTKTEFAAFAKVLGSILRRNAQSYITQRKRSMAIWTTCGDEIGLAQATIFHHIKKHWMRLGS